MCAQLVYVYFVMPETKGVPLEQLQRQILGEDIQIGKAED